MAPWIIPTLNFLTEVLRLRRTKKEAQPCSLPAGHDGPCNGLPCESMVKHARENEGQ